MPENDKGDHFAMRDYHILSMDSVGGKVTDHGVALDTKDIPWAGRQLWAPDAAFKSGTYYLYFPVKDKQDVFRIGVATSSSPTGPFKAEPKPMEGSFSIDPAAVAGLVPATDATPLTAPFWFRCLSAGRLTGDLAAGAATAYHIGRNQPEGFDLMLAVYPDGRGYLWRQLNGDFAE